MDVAAIRTGHHVRLDDPDYGPIATVLLVAGGGRVGVCLGTVPTFVDAARLHAIPLGPPKQGRRRKPADSPKPSPLTGPLCVDGTRAHLWQIVRAWRNGKLVQVGTCDRCHQEREFRPRFRATDPQGWQLTGHRTEARP